MKSHKLPIYVVLLDLNDLNGLKKHLRKVV